MGYFNQALIQTFSYKLSQHWEQSTRFWLFWNIRAYPIPFFSRLQVGDELYENEIGNLLPISSVSFSFDRIALCDWLRFWLPPWENHPFREHFVLILTFNPSSVSLVPLPSSGARLSRFCGLKNAFINNSEIQPHRHRHQSLWICNLNHDGSGKYTCINTDFPGSTNTPHI